MKTSVFLVVRYMFPPRSSSNESITKSSNESSRWIYF